MKKIATILGASALLALVAGSAFAANAVRISQIYTAGGNTGATYQAKYVELFNSSGSPVNISNWAIVYGSSTGSWNSAGGTTYTNSWVFPSGTSIKGCGYLLVAFTTTGAGGALPVTPDFNTISPAPIISMSGTNGKLMLTQSVPANAVACGAEGVVVVDKIAYGPSSTCAETTPTASLSATTGDVRKLGGMTDTDSNVGDFVVTTAPVPNNSASPINSGCTVTATHSTTWGQVKSIYR